MRLLVRVIEGNLARQEPTQRPARPRRARKPSTPDRT
jgi:hypothetical protein